MLRRINITFPCVYQYNLGTRTIIMYCTKKRKYYNILQIVINNRYISISPSTPLGGIGNISYTGFWIRL